MPPPERPQHLEPSKLGTKEYWDNLYTNELSNHAADSSDIGTVWFDDSDAEAKTLEFLSSLPSLDPARTSILDLGCGNGSLLFSLRDYNGTDHDDGDDDVEGERNASWQGRMLGVDYSPQSVALARQILASAVDRPREQMDFREWDVLAGSLSTVLDGEQVDGWDVVHDKGTFDAISLSEEKDPQGCRLCEGYCDRVLKLVRREGYFIVTSCNWTEPELRAWFEGEEGRGFVVDGRVEYRTYSFGGVKGQTVTTLCFRKS